MKFHLFLTILVTASAALAFSPKPPVKQETVYVRPSPSPVIVDAKAGREMLAEIATKDSCAKQVYAEKGSPPAGYMKGLVLTYVKTICSPGSDVYKIGTQALGDPKKDALSHYDLKPEKPTDRLNNVFAMLIGSNARESDWRWCVGRDIKAKASDLRECLRGSGSTCEAGLTQTSYNSVPKAGPMRDLFESFLEYPLGCFAPEYKVKARCSTEDFKTYGSDPKARAYQVLSKECPGFAIESGVIMFRTVMSHYGPVKRKTALVKPACVSMFERVRAEVLKDPNLCHVL